MSDDEYHTALLGHARALGMDPDEDEEFLWLAEEALKAELPPGWEMVMGEGEHEGVPFYYNEELNESVWEHPMDEHYREEFKRLKAEAQRRRRGQHQSPHRQSSRERYRDDDDRYREEEDRSPRRGGGYDERSYDGRSGGSPSRRAARDEFDDDDEHDRRRGYSKGRQEEEEEDRRRGYSRGREEEDEEDDRRRGYSKGREEEEEDDRRRGYGERDRRREDSFDQTPARGGSHRSGSERGGQAPHGHDDVEVQDLESFDEEDFGHSHSHSQTHSQAHSPSKSIKSQRSRGREEEEERVGRGGRGGLRAGDSLASEPSARRSTSPPADARGSYYQEYDEFDDDRGRGQFSEVGRERSQYGRGGQPEEEDEEVEVYRQRQGQQWRQEGAHEEHRGATKPVRRGAGTQWRVGGSGEEEEEEEEDFVVGQARGKGLRGFAALGRRSEEGQDDEEDFNTPLPVEVRDRDKTAGPVSGRGLNMPTPKSSEVNLATYASPPRERGREEENQEVRVLEQRLANVTARAEQAEERLRRAEEERRSALDELRQELEARHREEVEHVKEAGREAQDQAITLQADAWGRERTELIRMRRNVEGEVGELEEKVRELEKATAEAKKALRAEQEAGHKGAEEAFERARASAREEAEQEAQKRLDEVLRRGREREAALQSQLDDQSNKMMELLDREDEATDSRTAELEDAIATLRHEAEGLRAAVEEEREARVRQERMARDAFKAKDADMTALEACLAEARERESALLQEKIQAEARAERAAREAQGAVHEREMALESSDALVLERQAAQAALASVSRELSDSHALVARLKVELAEAERALAGHRAELHRVQGEVGQTASRERALEEDLARLKADADTRIAAVERRAADVQNANAALQRELVAVQDDAHTRLREVESHRDLLEYEKQRAEDRAVAAENWRQKEGARAKQAEEALEACRAELSTLREDLASVDNIIVKAERPHKVRIAELEAELSASRQRLEEHDREVAALGLRHEAHIANLKAEVSAKLPMITAAAMRKVEEEWRRRVDDECRVVREAGDREAEGSHLRVVALKSQLLETQAKLQSQLSAERLNVESLQRSLTKAEEEARGLRKELDDLRYKHNLPTPHKHVISASVAHAPASAGMVSAPLPPAVSSGMVAPPAAPSSLLTPSTLLSWDQAMQSSMFNLLQSHLSVLQAQFSTNNSSSASSSFPSRAADSSFPYTPTHHGLYTPTATISGDTGMPERAFTYDEPPRRGTPVRFRDSADKDRAAALHENARGDMSVTTAAVLDEDERFLHSLTHATSPPRGRGFANSAGSGGGGEEGEAMFGMSVMSDPGTGFYEGYWRAKYARDTSEEPHGGHGSGHGGLGAHHQPPHSTSGVHAAAFGLTRKMGRGARKTSVSFVHGLTASHASTASPARLGATTMSSMVQQAAR